MTELYMDLYTGEVLTFEEMQEVFVSEYDGDDPTNCVPWTEYFEPLSTHKKVPVQESVLYDIYGDELEVLV